MYNKYELLKNIDKIHTTELGEIRIIKNISLEIEDVVNWCKDKICLQEAEIEKKGKNWYISVDRYVITVNASSYTIITAHNLYLGIKRWLCRN